MDSLNSEQINKTNIFETTGINKLLNNFKSKNNHQGQFIWNILMIQNWMIENNIAE